VDNATFQTPQKSKQGHLGEGTECVETEMRQCQGNSLFFCQQHKNCTTVLRKRQKILTQFIQQTVQEKQERIIGSVDHILQHDLVRENSLAAEFVSAIEREMQNIKECFNTKNYVDSRIKE
jgi:hypothetical protein